MSLKIDRVELEIVIKNDQSRKRLRELEGDMRDARKELKKYKEGTDEYVAAAAKLRTAQTEYDKLFEKIGLGNLSIKELQRRQSELNAIIKHLPGNSPLLDQYRKQLKDVTSRIGELSGKATASGFSLSKMANGINKYFGMLTVGIAGITGASMAFRKMAEDFAHMDDVYSDVRKTTNLTKEEILSLNEEFKKMDTRTSRESLNNLARDAGKLGIEGSKNILDFVDAGNQINVALGEDLGEDAIKNIGKMVGVFDKSTKELQGLGLKEQMLAVGSAINSLGAASSADEGFLVAFAGRLGGISKQANISMDAILGFGSALDQDMQQVEMSATALQNFIMKLMGDPAKFAKLAGLEVKGFTKLLNTDANAAIKQVLRAMNEKGGFQALIPIFQDMGLDGARAVGVLSSMAGSIDKIDEAQLLANKSMAEGTSVTKEYNIKNSNMAAQLDKAKKGFNETALALGSSLNPILLKSTNLLTYLTRGLVELPKWLNENKGLIWSLAVVMTAYAIAISRAKIASAEQLVIEKVKLIWQKANTAATLLQVAVTGYLTGATRAANLATKAFFTTLGLNPYVAIGVAIAAVTIGIYKLATAKTIAEKAMKSYNTQMNTEILRSDQLFNALKKSKEGTQTRKDLITKINEIYGKYIGYQLNEKDNLDKITTAQNNVNNALRSKIAIQVRDQAKADVTEKYIKQQVSIINTMTNAIAATEGDDVANVMVNRIKDIITTAKTYDEGVQAARKYMSDKLGKNFTPGMEFYPSNLAKSFRLMKNDLDFIDKSYSVLISKVSSTPPPPPGPKEGDERIGADGKTLVFKSGKWVEKKISPPPGGDDDPHKEEVAALDKKLLAEQVKLKQSGKSKEEFDKGMLDLEVEYLKKKRDLYAKDSAQYNEYENRLQDIEMAKKITANEASLKVIQDAHSATLRAIDVFENTKREKLQDDLDSGIISQEDYASETLALDKALAEKRLQEAKDFSELISDAKFNSKEEKDKAVAAATDAVNAEAAALLKAEKAITKNKLQNEKEHLVKVAKLREELGLNKEKLSYKEGLKALKKKLKEAEASEKESADAINSYKLKKGEEYAQEALRFVNTVADFVSASNDAQAASLEASKQRELTAAGNNADAREKIEKKYAQKELDLKKKQADANMAIGIAQAIAQGALGIAQIWDVNGINPIYAGILTALLVGITGMNIKSAVEQRNAIKSTSLGYFDGGMTKSDPDDHKEVGVVHANEFVNKADGVRNPAVRKFLDVFDIAQKNGTIRMLNTTQILEKVKLSGGSRRSGGYGSEMPGNSSSYGSDQSLMLNAFSDLVNQYSYMHKKLMDRLDQPIEAYSLISGPKGSYEQTKKFQTMLGNVSR